MIKTRFAPSPTGFLHIGGARTALFSWLFARHHGGQFVLRVEDTDIARSEPQMVQAILDGLDWLGLDYDEGPFYQTQRLTRYQSVITQMLEAGTAYHCYMSVAELDTLRQTQRQNGEKPRYNGAWRPEDGKKLPDIPQDVTPVVRFKNPESGSTHWTDLIKGEIKFDNTELDDFIIARADGTPTYNFCVVIDDWDMQITHTIRGDDHVNNTPRQINLFRALGIEPPHYAHLSMILGSDGQKLSKRHGAVSVMQYQEAGFLPEAVINYLSRLGWSHGDDEVFGLNQLIEWFNLEQITSSAAQFDTEKLLWLNQHYIKQMPLPQLAERLEPYLAQRGVKISDSPLLTDVLALYQARCQTLQTLAEEVSIFYQEIELDQTLLEHHVSDEVRPALHDFLSAVATVDWQVETVSALIKTLIGKHELKMPKLAMPLRIILAGREKTPSVDALIVLIGRNRVIERLQRVLS